MNIDISPFTGSIHEDPVKWIDEYSRKSRFLKEDGQVEQVRFYFEKTAKFWYDEEIQMKQKDLSFQDFRKLFLTRFMSEDIRLAAIKKLKSMKYELEDNTVSNFITDFKHFYKKVYPKAEDGDIVLEIFEKFPAELQSKIVSQISITEVKTLVDLQMVAERSAKSVRIDNDVMKKVYSVKKEKTDVVISGLMDELKVIKTQLAEIMNNQKSSSRKRKCYKCSGDWPSCGCTQKCRKCQGEWPKCPCASAKNSNDLNDNRLTQ